MVEYVVHSGADSGIPWANRTVVGCTGKKIFNRTGSRYVTSSPCEAIDRIESTPGRCVFICKPCDISAMRAAISVRPQLGDKAQFVLTFFCAGNPSTRGPKDLLAKFGADSESVQSIRYRGNGWPREFRVEIKDGAVRTFSYKDSW